jgi:hypothetical protein
MTIIPGIKYLETRAMLIERIRDENISVLEQEAENHACYFCTKRIRGKMMVLSDSETINRRVHETKYYIDINCYEEAKQPPDFRNYEITTPLSMN